MGFYNGETGKTLGLLLGFRKQRSGFYRIFGFLSGALCSLFRHKSIVSKPVPLCEGPYRGIALAGELVGVAHGLDDIFCDVAVSRLEFRPFGGRYIE